MNTRILSATVVVLMFVLCQHVHAQVEEDPEPVQATELEGTWEIVSLVAEGEQQEIPANGGFFLRCEGNCLYLLRGDGWEPIGLLSVNPEAMPGEFDLQEGDETVGRGIYELDGDSLRVCYGTNRPDRFESTEDYPTYLFVLRRVEEEE